MSTSALVLLRWNAGGNPLAPLNQLHGPYERKVLEAIHGFLISSHPYAEIPPLNSFRAIQVDNPGANEDCAAILDAASPQMIVVVVDPDEAMPGTCLALAALVPASPSDDDQEKFYCTVSVQPSVTPHFGLPSIQVEPVDSMWVMRREASRTG